MKTALLILTILISEVSAMQVRAFTSDFCTGYREGTRSAPELWKDCCLEHDLYLWAGGNKKHRLRADRKLKTCVKERGARYHSSFMYIGVRLGRLSPIKIKGKQWGNAWGNKVRRNKLSPEEIDILQTSLEENHLLQADQIDFFINDLKTVNQ